MTKTPRDDEAQPGRRETRITTSKAGHAAQLFSIKARLNDPAYESLITHPKVVNRLLHDLLRVGADV